MAESLISCTLAAYPPAIYLPDSLTAWWIFPSIPGWIRTLTLALGLLLVPLGQLVRSLAMVQAGGNFNHIVQARKASTHQLVTSGIYSVSRHPSYFGFFWWGLGTQLVLGNVVCFVGYAGVLWVFFKRRIAGEEEYLVRFFGREYIDYRARTGHAQRRYTDDIMRRHAHEEFMQQCAQCEDRDRGLPWGPAASDEGGENVPLHELVDGFIPRAPRGKDVPLHELVDWFIPRAPVCAYAVGIPPVAVEIPVAEAGYLSQGIEERLEEGEEASEPDDEGDGGEFHEALEDGD
ncbi:hypothetical protein V495_03489 [Pseudogymnoascus sp. VKM F-4514 (FW-929)]|nr:hypothetical protein V495_03489 [Pseudogymnoascus sp. VKM F-4514 (FW-929)]